MNNMSPLPRWRMIGFLPSGETAHPPPHQLVSRRPGTGILLALPGAIRHFQVAHNRQYGRSQSHLR